MPPSPAEPRTGWVLRHPSKFGTITVRARKNGTRTYRQKGGNQSTVDEQGVSLDTYIHALYGLALQRTSMSTLMIGCAGGTLATMLARTGRKIAIVDIDRAAFKLAKLYFALPKSIACHVSDGLMFLKKVRKRYDTIILDAFVGEEIPDHLKGGYFFKAVKTRVRPDGLVLVNVCLHGRADPTADTIAKGFMALGWPAKIFDEPGGARNAIVCAGNVKGLRKPGISALPTVEVGLLRKNIRAMKFRKARAAKVKRG